MVFLQKQNDMRIKYLIGMVLPLLLTLLVSGCNDDNIFFTQNILEGDIVTENERELENNTLVMHVGEYQSVNIRGGKGAYTVASENDLVATASVYNGERSMVDVYAVGLGVTMINVTDSNDLTASFIVKVVDD